MMKQNPQYVNGYKAPKYVCKVHLNSWFERLIWWAFRRYLLNEDYYRLVTRYTGPRPRYAHSTKKENATAHRYYIEPRFKRVATIHNISSWRDIK